MTAIIQDTAFFDAGGDHDAARIASPRGYGGVYSGLPRPARSSGPARSVAPMLDLAVALVAIGVLALIQGEPDPVIGLLAPLWLALLHACRAYEPAHLEPRRAAFRGVLRAAVTLGLGCWVSSALALVSTTSPHLLLLTGILTSGSVAHRAIVAAHQRRRTLPRTRVVLVGRPDAVRCMLARVARCGSPFEVVAACLPGTDEDPCFGRLPVSTGLDTLGESVERHRAGAVLVLPDHELSGRALHRIAWQLERTSAELYVGTGLVDVALPRATLTTTSGCGVLHVTRPRRAGLGCHLKECGERLVAALALVVLLPLLVTIAVAVRATSAGPAIFRQTRVGRNGRTFTMYKFRTMFVDAETHLEDLLERNEADGALFKIRRDPRVTAVGRVLRTYSLDELPQLLNVLVGQMSLVGPRPALPHEVATYDADLQRRLVVKPGLTGLWQVSGRSDLSWEESARLDLAYVDNWSPQLDLAILARTFRAVFGHQGAY